MEGELLRDTMLRPGAEMQLRCRNTGAEHLWVTALFLDANYGIDILFSVQVPAGGKLEPINFAIDDKSFGTEGFVVLAVPVSAQKLEPSYRFLKQEPLGVLDGKRSVKDAPDTPWGKLLTAAATGEGAGERRGMVRRVPTNPAVQVRSWVTVR
jgi:hypothetical protein